jgi:prepilin peptidase CpaA
MTEAAVVIFFPMLMAFAACSDLFTMKISNRVSIALLAGFLPLALMLNMPFMLILSHLSCGAAILVMTFTFFSFGWVGGGDAKLAAATATWLGWDTIMDYGVVAAVFGGALTLGLLAVRKWPLPSALMQRVWIARLHDEKSGIPYGIALAAAGLMVYPHTQVWVRAIVA